MHLEDATADELDEFARLSAKLLGVTFIRRADGSLRYAAACAGFQTWGTVGLTRPDPLPPGGHATWGPPVRQDFIDNAWWRTDANERVQ